MCPCFARWALASRKCLVVEPGLARTLVRRYNRKSHWRSFIRAHNRCALGYIDDLTRPQGSNHSAGVGQSPINFVCPQVLMWSFVLKCRSCSETRALRASHGRVLCTVPLYVPAKFDFEWVAPKCALASRYRLLYPTALYSQSPNSSLNPPSAVLTRLKARDVFAL